MVDSPCIDICTIDPDSNLCIGCGKTLEEIKNWFNFTTKEKEIVLKSLEIRNKISTKQNKNMLVKRSRIWKILLK